MKDVIQGVVDTLRDGRPCVLATVVRTKAQHRRRRAPCCWSRTTAAASAPWAAGCVEGDIWFAAKEILREGGGPEFKDYYLNEDIAARDGLVCGGTMYFYLEPLRQLEDFLPLGDEILEAYDGGEPVSLATVVNSPKRPERLGAKLLLSADGTVSGTLGAESLDEPALEVARRIAEIGNTESLSTEDGAEIFVEGFTTPPTLVMVGGGHVGKATADLANFLGYRVYIVDDRPEFSNEERFPYAEETIVTPYDHWSDHLSINVNTFVVVATRGHRYDDMALESALKTRARYIGLLGSRRKTLMIYRRLMEQGVSRERIREVYAPIGLNIGALTPEEIAVSIMSEVIMVRRGGDGGRMTMGDWYIDRAASIVERAVEV